ncbi:hypothetical protein [uncultured Bradyrhizobium sp.]|jgi:hypothetical protein|uniref:hypothetical protein n=1 Tax=uncultured Bradyrhizobium sp. TaxID=199684 RepID=UPI00261F4E38|nr:hypothetical protein [uncultured Bradyrhizobium sp.]
MQSAKPSRQGAATILALRRAERDVVKARKRAKRARPGDKMLALIRLRDAVTAALSLTPRGGVRA